MLRRGLFSAMGLAMVLFFFFGRDAASYVGTSAGWLKRSVKNSVPVEFEIERARKMVQDLVPDIRKNMHVIAQEEVEVARLEKQIATSEKGLAKDRGDLVRLKNDLSSNPGSFHYAGHTYTENQVKTDLANRLERVKTNDATLASLREIHTARTQGLSAARQKLEGMLVAKRKLEADVENLEARLKMVEVAQTTSEVNIDDSQLGRVKQLITDVRTRLAVAEKMVTAESQYHGEIPLDEPVAENILEQVTEYLNGQGLQLAENEE